MTTTTLVLGGPRSGKIAHAQSLLPHEQVTFITAPSTSDDEGWSARVRSQPFDLPSTWTTVESNDVTRAILHARTPVLVGCLAGWICALLDESESWEDPRRALAIVEEKGAELAALWSLAPYDSVAVSFEPGIADVPDTPAGRLFQDGLGRLNSALSAVSKQVHLVVAGRLLDLSDAPVV